jgi:hypothetical protein
MTTLTPVRAASLWVPAGIMLGTINHGDAHHARY